MLTHIRDELHRLSVMTKCTADCGVIISLYDNSVDHTYMLRLSLVWSLVVADMNDGRGVCVFFSERNNALAL